MIAEITSQFLPRYCQRLLSGTASRFLPGFLSEDLRGFHPKLPSVFLKEFFFIFLAEFSQRSLEVLPVISIGFAEICFGAFTKFLFGSQRFSGVFQEFLLIHLLKYLIALRGYPNHSPRIFSVFFSRFLREFVNSLYRNIFTGFIP